MKHHELLAGIFCQTSPSVQDRAPNAANYVTLGGTCCSAVADALALQIEY